MKKKNVKLLIPKIIYEDRDVLVVNKPAGLVVHPDGKTEEPALTDWVLKKYPKLKNVGEPARYNGKEIPRPGIVHRLDRETSGVLVIAKTQAAFFALKKAFQRHAIKKTYYAFVYGAPKRTTGIIELPIGRSGNDFRRWSALTTARGMKREAITEYRVLEKSKTHAFVELIPKTGRTHQIRVHLNTIGHPVICDTLYAPKRLSALGFSRTALHAYAVELTLPNATRMRFEAPLPKDFIAAQDFLRKEAGYDKMRFHDVNRSN